MLNQNSSLIYIYEDFYVSTFLTMKEFIDYPKSFQNFNFEQKTEILAAFLEDLMHTGEAWEYLSLTSINDEWPFYGVFEDRFSVDVDKFNNALSTLIAVIRKPMCSFERSRQTQWSTFLWNYFEDELYRVYENILSYRERLRYEDELEAGNYSYSSLNDFL